MKDILKESYGYIFEEALLEEIEKLNLISKQLYDELDEMKRKYAQVDLTLRDKFEM